MSHDEIAALNKKIDEIHVALVGNPDLGHDGIVHRIERVENRISDMDRTMLKWGGIAVGVSLMVTTLKEKILN